MSNKNLAIILIIIVVAAAAVASVLLYRNNQRNQERTDIQAEQNSPTNQGSNDQTNDSPSPDTTASTSPQQASSTPETAQACTRNFDANVLKSATVDIKNRQIQFDVTGFGKITADLYDKDAPKTVENFLRLANSGYYNCLTFHRVAKGFVIQGGDPTGTGSGGDSAFGGAFADELNASSTSYQAGYLHGVLAMANAGPNTNTSQFFIMLADVQLPHSYTIFGKVSSGLDVVDKIGQVDITPQMGPTDGKPVTPVVMQTVKIIK